MATPVNGSCSSSLGASGPAKRQKSMPLHEKVDLLNRIKELPPGTTIMKMCVMFGIPKSTLSRIIKSEAKLRENFRHHKYFRRYTPSKDPDVDDMLKEWFYAARGQGMPITKPLLKVKAEELAYKLGRTEFFATDGWMSRWQVRHNVSFKRGQETMKLDLPSAQDWFTKILPDLIEEYGPEGVYYATETGLFYRAAPDTAFTFSCERSERESSKAMEQVTVLLCSNMTGRDKRKLLLVGENTSPVCFQDLDINRLPVTYRASSGALMTAGVFDEWLSEWDARLRAEDRKVLVLVQRCSAHPPLTTLCNIRLEFLPPCTSAVAHPLHQGVVKKLKTLYRLEILRFVQSCVEYNLMLPDAEGLTDVSGRITLLDAVQFLAKSWRSIPESLIRAAFLKAGFEFPADEECNSMSVDLNEEQLEHTLAVLGVPKMENWEEYDSIDDAVQCVEENNPEEDLVEAVVAAKKRQLLQLMSQSEDSCSASGLHLETMEDVTELTHDNGVVNGGDATSFQNEETAAANGMSALNHSGPEEHVPVVTNLEAKQSLSTLQRFCTQQGMSESICSLLDKLQDELSSFLYQENQNNLGL